MQLSKYNSIVPDYPLPGQHLVYNWLTQAMLVADDEVKDVITGVGQANPCQIPEDVERELVAQGILVQDEAEERRHLERWHTQVRKDPKTFKAAVLTTYSCNFGCPYCVQDGITSRGRLDEETAEAITNWIIARMRKQESKKLFLNFFGGEPLLNLQGVLGVAGALSAHCRAAGLDFEGCITTNASRLDRETALRLSEVGIQWAKVTLDGDKDAHDAKRPFKGGKGSFDAIMRNIEEVYDIIGIWIGGNFELENMDVAQRVTDELEKRGLAGKLWGVRYGGISEPAVEGLRRAGDQKLLEIEGLNGPSEPEAPAIVADAGEHIDAQMAAELLRINREVRQSGMPGRKMLGASQCMLNQEDNEVVVDPGGKVYKCPALVGHEDFVVGDIWHDELDDAHLRMHDGELADCKECRWFPPCGGGCRFGSFVETGDIRSRNCNKEYYDRFANEMIKADREALQTA